MTKRDALREQWAAGSSASAIATALGVTRNEVIAEAHRITPLPDGSLPVYAAPSPATWAGEVDKDRAGDDARAAS